MLHKFISLFAPSVSLFIINRKLEKKRRLYEEIPFADFEQRYKDWATLAEDDLKRNISSEKDRFRLLSDKLLRATSIASFVLVIISAVAFSTNLHKFFHSYSSIGFLIAAVYFVCATFQSLRALVSGLYYAHGPDWDLQIKRMSAANRLEEMVRILALYEVVNLVKNNQNSATFENARNGLIILLLSVIGFLMQQWLSQ